MEIWVATLSSDSFGDFMISPRGPWRRWSAMLD
jgi:hypothetical protein